MARQRRIPNRSQKRQSTPDHLQSLFAQSNNIAPSQSKVNMYDPVLLAQLKAVSDVDFNSYFVCLAAYQRGLTVTFHRNLADAQFAFQTTRGYNAELFSVSDGRTTHYFDRTIGDITDPTATVISKDKHQTKSVLQAAGIPTPDGIIFYKSQIKLVEKFLEQTRNSLYVLKPFNGSLARDVHIKLRAADVMTSYYLKTLHQKIPDCQP